MYVPDPMDATRRREEWSNTLSRAELLMPGVRLPTFDAKFDDQALSGMLCDFKRKTLAASFETDKGNQAIRAFVTTDCPNFRKMTSDAVDVLFTAASERARERNNIMSVSRGPAMMKQQGPVPKTPAEVNAFNRAYWENRDKGFNV